MKLKPKNEVKGMEVYYDGRCGACCTFVDWLVRRKRAFEVECVPYQADEVGERFPEIWDYDPARQLVVRVKGGGEKADTEDHAQIYQGAEAWVWCLWSCAGYGMLAKILNCKLMLPMGKKCCYFISKYRLKISKVFFGKRSKQLADELHDVSKAGKEAETLATEEKRKH